MKSYIGIAAGIAAFLMTATPVLAQTPSNGVKPNPQVQPSGGGSSDTTFDASTGAQKQHTQGLPAGTTSPQYGTDWSRKQQQPTKTQ